MSTKNVTLQELLKKLNAVKQTQTGNYTTINLDGDYPYYSLINSVGSLINTAVGALYYKVESDQEINAKEIVNIHSIIDVLKIAEQITFSMYDEADVLDTLHTMKE
ncbi:hypothetical protein [Capnocytophaga sp.]|uniref:hypothetical protein n=1 Tax=Capnocytophaga sp. TaxID=44737 RepID=UPI0026DD5B57|nr:hypothetical protein [Capnocytophaga sp.]MDO5105804.1 hypothetical protein [Capnocytophaga sp.]